MHANTRASPSHVTAAPTDVAMWSDSTSHAPEAQIYRLWQAYYKSKRHSLAEYASAPSELWVPEEQTKWLLYDLAGYYQPSDGIAEIENIERVSTSPLRYEISVYFATHDVGVGSNGKPIPLKFTKLIYSAVEKDGHWLLASVLPYRAQSWETHTIGPITFFVDPKLKFNRMRAERAVAFIDSLATAFGVPKLTHLDYYSASSVDAAQELLGVVDGARFGAVGGFDKAVNKQTFSGDPFWGENYRHELVHNVLHSLTAQETTLIASEGLATWLGGTTKMTFVQAVKNFNRFLSRHPTVTIDSALVAKVEQRERYVTGAVLCEMLFARGGLPALKQFINSTSGVDDQRETLQLIFGKSWEQINADWRAEVKRIASGKPRSTLG
ncbi:MAG: hypothetical protein ABJC26_11570 [Gemmatimonadaceae bacterium]